MITTKSAGVRPVNLLGSYLAALAITAGCSFDPQLPEGKIACTANASCPSGFTCQDGLCRSKPVRDGSPAIEPAVDGPPSEPLDAPGEPAGAADGAADIGEVSASWDSSAPDARSGPDLGSLAPETGLPASGDARADDATDVPIGPDGAGPDASSVAETGIPASEDARSDDATDVPIGPDGAGPDASFADAGSPDSARDVRPDSLVADAPCATTCSPGDKRCGSGGLQTCQLVGSCHEWGPAVACTGNKTCQGAEPYAECKCPAAPSYCASVGNTCLDGSTLAACVEDSNHCVTASTSDCTLSGKVCSGTFPDAKCDCPPPPPGCENGAGSSCSAGSVVKCTEVNGCLVATSSACASGKPCAGAFPSAKCTCPTPPPAYCTEEGSMCADGTTLSTCAFDSNQCMTASSLSCAATGKVCTGSMPNAKCTCAATPADCAQGVGSRCSGSSTQVTCSAIGECYSSATTTCSSGQYCSGAFPSGACAPPTALGWYDDLGSSGNRAANVLLGYPVTVSSPSVLRKFGLIARAAGNAQIILYASNASGEPSARVAYASPVSITAGRNELAPTSTPSTPSLAAGKYWIMMVFQSQISVAQDTSATAERRYVSFNYGGGLPDPMPATILSPAAQSNFYILVTPQ